MTEAGPQAGPLPQSDALAEAGAGAENIGELLARDPEKYTQQEESAIVAFFQQKRKEWEVLDSAPKAPRARGHATTSATQQNLGDFM
jgi:hypothetical protein